MPRYCVSYQIHTYIEVPEDMVFESSGDVGDWVLEQADLVPLKEWAFDDVYYDEW